MSKKFISKSRPRGLADVALLVTTALIASLAVAATAVSLGIARMTILG